ncbi:MAG: molybdenum cofactor guanylyltransferase [Gammaproteobacteria bacterium]|nr:MAG: molybdenum cofactor guanylyltransferase [Gammaproteobacteria bacterium]
MLDGKSACTGLVLAGGLSTRMGADKAQLRRNEQTMLAYACQLLESLGLPVAVSGGRTGIPDLVPQAGPLGGVYSALKQLQPKALLVVPVDMPLLGVDTLRPLIEQGEVLGVPVCYRDCYLPLYLPSSAQLKTYLEEVFVPDSHKPRSVKKLLAALGAVQLPVADEQALINTNTPEEWQRARALFAGAGDQ